MRYKSKSALIHLCLFFIINFSADRHFFKEFCYMQPTLLVLAAGMGSRYGGVKQIDSVGKNGECLLFSAFDAKRSGFGKVVFIQNTMLLQKNRTRSFSAAGSACTATSTWTTPLPQRWRWRKKSSRVSWTCGCSPLQLDEKLSILHRQFLSRIMRIWK